MKKSQKVFALVSIVLALSFAVGTFASCTKQSYDPEARPLTMSISTPDGVFNPFFSTSAYDSSVVGMTQISMLSSDENGSIVCGDDEPTVVKDYTTNTYTDESGKQYTDYYFIIKNGIKFSDGVELTIKDVLFNLYFYLDPVYTGSATIYSTDIVGLQAYRQQNTSLMDEDKFEDTFTTKAQNRITDLVDYIKSIDPSYKEDDKPDEEQWTSEQIAQFREDYVLVAETFLEELISDWNSTDLTSYTDWGFTAKWQVYMMNDGQATELLAKDSSGKYIKDDNGNYQLDTAAAENYEKSLNDYITEHSASGLSTDELTKNWAIYSVFGNYFLDGVDDKGDYDATKFDESNLDETISKTRATSFSTILSQWNTYNTILSDFTAEEKTNYFSSGTRSVKTIQGIDGTGTTTEDYHGNNLGEEHSVLKITINGVDPKAIWNFAFTVAPLHYYSTHDYEGVDYIGSFSEEDGNFGFKFSDVDFVNSVIKDPDKIDLPVGGGAYMASTINGGAATDGGNFFNNNIIYYERNPYFCTLFGVDADSSEASSKNAQIKYFRYKVVETDQIISSLINNEIDIGEPNAVQDSIDKVEAQSSLAYVLTDTSGYGYVGVNPRFVPNIVVRRAIMKAMNTAIIMQNYYTGGLASQIWRPMSKTSWAYPTDATVYTSQDGTSYAYDSTGNEILEMLTEDGYTLGSDGILTKNITGYGEDKLEYTFTIAGASQDHPAYAMFLNAQTILNRIGFKIKVVTSSTALSDLSTGKLTVWAAAWSSTIDPDMYQVYHKDSKATSVNNWGYPQIKANKTLYATEYQLITRLSTLIDEGRATLVQSEREDIYAEALDLVMELAVEMPTYQRKDMTVYNKEVLDRDSMTPADKLTSYNGLFSRIWEVTYNK